MITLKKADGIWTVALDRAEKANALTSEMLGELISIMQEAQAARAVILTAHGQVFSAGADLEEAHRGLAISSLWEELSGAIAALPGLAIAALNGTVAGGALGMVLACDLRFAVPSASFFYPVIKKGFLPQPSDPHRLRLLIGPAKTKLVLMAGARLSADEALAFGLIDRILEPTHLMSEAVETAKQITASDATLARQIKDMCNGPEASR